MILCLLKGIRGQGNSCTNSWLLAIYLIVCVESCVDGNTRLVGGRNGATDEGRLEICRNNEWGTVCNEDWDLTDAWVACQELFPGVDIDGMYEHAALASSACASLLTIMLHTATSCSYV